MKKGIIIWVLCFLIVIGTTSYFGWVAYSNKMAELTISESMEKYLNDNFEYQFKAFANNTEDRAAISLTILIKGVHNLNIGGFTDKLEDWCEQEECYGVVDFIMVSDEYFDSVSNSTFDQSEVEKEAKFSIKCELVHPQKELYQQEVLNVQ